MTANIGVIPAEYTSKIQQLDVVINKPFKGILRDSWAECMSVNNQGHQECIKAPLKQRECAWKVLTQDQAMLSNSFLVCGISNAMDTSEDHYYRSDEQMRKNDDEFISFETDDYDLEEDMVLSKVKVC